ncbi:hybrid sensor histidine kinase/response regulator [candidate division TA06 bacterium]|nr:hybrid sensor histidine kinase/response regulator [candidate division TA06 bacterium]
MGNGGKWLFITAVTLKDHQGKIIGALETLEDITERRNSEEALRKSEEEVRRINESLELRVQERTRELEAATKELEAFSYSVSHDLRAPLRTIDGFGQALLEDCAEKLDAQGKDHLRRIRAATQRMGGLIDDMLKLSRITRAEMNIENVSLTRIARSVIAELQNGQPGRSAKVIIAEGLEDRADPRLIRIALENLLGNAWKFTGKQPEASIEFGCTAEGGSRTYFIRDNGAGFDMAYVSKLFTPFQRLHSMDEFPGTGIGLGTVQRIIQRHGGKLRAEGQAGKGATFYFTLNG